MEEKLKATIHTIFVNTQGKPCLDGDLFNIEWKKALIAGCVRYRRAYNCRHTYASLGLKAGAKPAFLAAQLGHSLQMFYSTYAKWINEDDDDAELALLEQYAQRVGEKVGEKAVKST